MPGAWGAGLVALVGSLERMYAIDELLHLIHSDGADRLTLHVGAPPVIVLDGESHTVEGPSLTSENVEGLLQSIADTRQRRELRDSGSVQFFYRFRGIADFVVRAEIKDEDIHIEIH